MLYFTLMRFLLGPHSEGRAVMGMGTITGEPYTTYIDDMGQLHHDQGLHGLGWGLHCHRENFGHDSQGTSVGGRETGCLQAILLAFECVVSCTYPFHMPPPQPLT